VIVALVGAGPEELVDEVAVGAVNSTTSKPSRRAAAARPKAAMVSAIAASVMAAPRGSPGASSPDGLSTSASGSQPLVALTEPTCQICGPILPPAA
jgi:hypothetical protein